MQHEKPKDLISSLGVDVELSSKELENDPWAQKMLREIGSTMRVEGMKYMGSICVHYYLQDSVLVQNNYELATKTQITFKEEISEQLAALGFNNAVIDMRKHYNPGFKNSTTRKGDKR